MRAIVSKQLGEAQALEADEHPFEWKGPDEIFAIYKVSNRSIRRPFRIAVGVLHAHTSSCIALQGLIEELSARLVANDRDHTPESQKAVVEVIHAMVSFLRP